MFFNIFALHFNIYISMISVSQVGLSFGAFELFSDITFMVNPKDRIGLTGKNGAGKSTLIKIIAGQQKADSGVVSIPSELVIGYLPQQMIFSGDRTVLEEASEAFSEVLALEKELITINHQLSTRDDYESEIYHNLIHRFSECNERFSIIGGAAIHADLEKTLFGLGFSQTDLTRKTYEFSGGWRMRIELAKILLKKCDVLLLDEPTNHLDIESIQWLEEYLENYQGAVILISHDRKFLDNVTKRTIEISLGKSYDYKVSYSKYVELRKERREQQMSAYRNQQKKIEDTEDFIERFRYKATKSVQVQSRIKQLDKLDRIEVDEEDTSSINVRFPTPVKSGKIVLEIKDLGKSYGHKEILKGIDLIVESGQHIAFVGKNGEGKSTLSKIIIKEISHTGHLKIGHNVKIGYFAQNQDELMNENMTVFDTIDQVAVGDIRTKIRDILGAFLFGGDDVYKKVKILSGGERSRLAIAKLLLEPYNLLVLDEPTNHLDLRSKDILKKALLNYEGTLVLVSHDRDFLDGLVEKVYEFKDKKIKEHLGGIYDFLQKKKMTSLRELEAKQKIIQNQETTEKGVSESKQNYLEKKENEKIIRKAANKVQESEKEIERLESDIKAMDKQLADPVFLEKNANNTPLFKMYDKMKAKLNEEMERWEKLNEELETIKASPAPPKEENKKEPHPNPLLKGEGGKKNNYIQSIK
jgi:ATP-binding cassette, subfamily F, member 3